jgi:hypothetical protein
MVFVAVQMGQSGDQMVLANNVPLFSMLPPPHASRASPIARAASTQNPVMNAMQITLVKYVSSVPLATRPRRTMMSFFNATEIYVGME